MRSTPPKPSACRRKTSSGPSSAAPANWTAETSMRFSTRATAAALEAKGIKSDVSEITRIPTSTVDLDAETARKVLKLMEKLDDHDDVQRVSANFNIPQEALAEIEG